MMAMKVYVVGGAVRDELLGLPVQDHDWVVVGATPEDMLAAGLPPGRQGFPGVPASRHAGGIRAGAHRAQDRAGLPRLRVPYLARRHARDDLVRRDLTINAMARAEDGAIVDPYGGQQDLQDRVFRHVSDAFAEDPVRILRLARFAARFPDFRVAEATNALMRRWSRAGEVDALVPERVWQELARG
jgi:tRNA nucleotidyltransferase (CCA-adding enzyme)